MDLNWLDDVLVLLEEGNMTRAAARRNITQPAFSRRIRAFEDWIGTPLLERRANAVDIGPALQASEPEIRALLARMRDLRGHIRHHDPARATLSVAAQHAPIVSSFPDMALHARRRFPALGFRLRAGNLSDCVSLFLRGDAQLLLCYEAQTARPMAFGEAIRRAVWGRDYLIPVVGGAQRYVVRDDGSVPEDTPAIVYPEASYFGEVLQAAQRPFGTRQLARVAFCETALSVGIKALVLAGHGVAWLPVGMVHGEVESGDMISLVRAFGQEPLETAVYADTRHPMAEQVLALWDRGRT